MAGLSMKSFCLSMSVHNLELIALDAMTRLQEVKLTHKTPGGADTFILKFNDAVNDLRDAGKPCDALFAEVYVP